jgi:hypothetical protein
MMVSVYYLHRKEEHLLCIVIRAMHSASMRMGFHLPRLNPVIDE